MKRDDARLVGKPWLDLKGPRPVILPPSVWEAAKAAGYDMRAFIVAEPIPKDE